MVQLADAKRFSKMDDSNGFWQMQLEEESLKKCILITPYGRYRFVRLPFGIPSASEVHHRTVHQLF